MNLLNAWKSFFVLEEQMLEVDCTSLTPENILKVYLKVIFVSRDKKFRDNKNKYIGEKLGNNVMRTSFYRQVDT